MTVTEALTNVYSKIQFCDFTRLINRLHSGYIPLAGEDCDKWGDLTERRACVEVLAMQRSPDDPLWGINNFVARLMEEFPYYRAALRRATPDMVRKAVFAAYAIAKKKEEAMRHAALVAEVKKPKWDSSNIPF